MKTTYRIVVILALFVGVALVPASGDDRPARARAEWPGPIDTSFLKDYALTRGFMLGRPASAKPTPDGKAVLFLRSQPRSPVMHLYEFDVATKETKVLLTPEQLLKGAEEKLSPEEKARRERMRITARGFTSYEIAPEGPLVLVSLSGKLYTFDRTNRTVRELPIGKGTVLDPKFSPDGKQIGYVLDHDVHVMDLETLKDRAVTTGGTEDVSHGLAEFVAQEEMDRHSGYWWSPDSKWIIYQDADAREVETWYVTDPAKPGQAAQPQRYPRPGKKNVRVALTIAAVNEPLRTSIKWDMERYPYLATVKWMKGGPPMLVVQSRDQRELLVLAVNPRNGETQTLLKEARKDWLNLDQSMPHWLETKNAWLWSTERHGHWQLEIRDVNGESERQLPSFMSYLPNSAMRGNGLIAVDEKSGFAYVRTGDYPHKAADINVKVSRVALDTLTLFGTAITDEPGVHSISFAKNFAIHVRTSSSMEGMSRTTVHTADGKLIAELPSVAEQPPFRPTSDIATIPMLVDKATNKIASGITKDKGTLVLMAPFSITRPRNFDATKKYPVIVDIYAGPGVRHVLATQGMYLRAQWLADQGFIVVAMDGRGVPNAQSSLERAIRGNFGVIPLDDQIAILQQAGKLYPELDLDRIGITGWSFGGYMSALAVLKRGDIFKAAVAGAPVSDWLDYDTHYTERYLGLPEENPQGYKESSLLTYAANLNRPLLLIHGTSDDNVFFSHTLKLSEALFRAGKEHEVMPLSGFTHMVPDPVVRQRLEEMVAMFFRKHL